MSWCNDRKYWLENPILHEYFVTCMWNIDKHWAEYILEKYNIKNANVLSIGCGEGVLERGLAKIGCAKRIDAFDIDEEKIIQAKKKANVEGLSNFINYFVADANIIKLPKNQYDLIVAHNSLHHIEKLEHLFLEVNKALKDSGIFVAVEFVGPNRFQWTPKQLMIVNNILKYLPVSYLRLDGNYLRTQVSQKTFEWYLKSDPTEATRSQEIVTLFHKFFKVIEVKDMGGTILHLLFSDIVRNFDDNRDVDRAIILILCYLEKLLIENRVISSDFKMLVGKKRVEAWNEGGESYEE